MIDNFSWVLPRKLAGMALPTSFFSGSEEDVLRDLEDLRRRGVRVVFSAKPMEPGFDDLCARANLDWLCYPIDNFDVPRDLPGFERALRTALDAVRREEPVCVHCYAGIGRTGLVLACLMGRFLKLSPGEAVKRVRANRESFDTEEQVRFVYDYLGDRPPGRRGEA